MKTPEFVESDSGESVVREVIDSSESRLNYRDGASGSSEELSAKSGVPVESRTHPRDYQAVSPSRGQKVSHGSGSISDPEQRTHLNNELNVHYSESSAGHRANRCSAGKYEEKSNFSDQGTLRVRNTGQDERALDQVTDHTSLTRSLVSPDTRPPSTVPSIAQPDKGIGSNQVYAPDIAVASTSISDGIVTGSQPRTISTDEIVAGHRVVSECRNSTGHRQSKAPNNLVSLRHASPGNLSPASKLRRRQVRESSALLNRSRFRSRSPSHRMRRNRIRSLSHQEKRNRSKKKKHRHRQTGLPLTLLPLPHRRIGLESIRGNRNTVGQDRNLVDMTGGQKDTGGIGLLHPIHLSLLKKEYSRDLGLIIRGMNILMMSSGPHLQ